MRRTNLLDGLTFGQAYWDVQVEGLRGVFLVCICEHLYERGEDVRMKQYCIYSAKLWKMVRYANEILYNKPYTPIRP